MKLWQHDLWWHIVSAALSGKPNQIDLSYHPALSKPAVAQWAATTPKLLKLFADWNRDKPLKEQVKPLGFLLSYFWDPLAPIEPTTSARTRWRKTGRRPIAPYDKDTEKAAKKAFDRRTGEPIPIENLKTVKQVLVQYHLHPEDKFHNGDFGDCGATRRRHILVNEIQHIGKEANHWEEQAHLGFDEEEQIDYGVAPKRKRALVLIARAAVKRFGLRETSRRMARFACYLIEAPEGRANQKDHCRKDRPL